MLDHAFLIPLIPALSFLLILGFGRRLPRGGSEIGLAAVAICFVLSCAVGVGWIQRVNHPPKAEHTTAVQHESSTPAIAGHGSEATPAGEHAAAGGEAHHVVEPVVRQVTWLQSGGVKLKVGTMVDGLAAMMLFVVSAISLLVHVFSTDYVAGDRRYTHYFAFLSLFTSAMLFYVLAENTLQMLVGWELVGLCSFALIGLWWEEKPNSDAALKAFLTNRVGDVGLLIGVTILFFAAKGSFNIIRINEMANSGQIRHLLLLMASISLLGAVMSKSGQFILHTWLPDAMAGPTPVSALIHAATMVVAGVYLIARLYGVFWHGLQIGHSNINLMAVMGAVTLLFGALLAFVQDDIKKVLAYSTISQLGYMVMALGVGAWTGGVFHLFTHAFFKACLFLGAGSLAHHIHSFDMKKDMGGLRKLMPKTFWTFVIGTAALVAVFPLAGFWSKDEILSGANGLGGPGGYKLMLVMGILGAACTGAYMTRVIWFVFYGERRGASATHDMHENGPRITVPLMILAGMAVVAGFANIPNTGALSWVPDSVALRFEHFVEPTAAYFPAGADAAFRHPEFNVLLATGSTIVALLAVLAAYGWFWKGLGPHGITERNRFARAGHRLLVNKYYLDHLYTDIIVGAVKGPIAKAANWVNQNVIDGAVNLVGRSTRESGEWVYKYIDQGVVDNVVKGSGMAAEGSGQFLRKAQTGKVQQYGAYLFLGATVLAAIFVIASS
ncbi:MAG: proton-translocating NADH-quinone oxidoreductase, chain [Acidimicrobiales bacterium]|nr:proton-translocating NADH-quinone oxidoreductase, chain [Acidimicrobiales bacterium]